MNRKLSILTVLALLIITLADPSLAQPFRVDGEFTVRIPDGWAQADSTGGYPYHFVDNTHMAELYLFRSSILPDETVDDEVMLEEAVAQVIDGVLPEMAIPRLQHSSGFLEGDHASFVLDFISDDSESGLRIYHRLKGVLYRLSDNSQVLFTLWAKTSPDNFRTHEPAIARLMSSFEFAGERQEQVFAPVGQKRGWYLSILVAALSAIALYLTRLRQRRLKASMVNDGNFWRCDCGRLNHLNRASCHRCGHEREMVSN
jgi:hypothetical protein